MAQFLTLAGLVGYLFSVLWLLTAARRSGFGWFLLCLFVSPLAVLFAATHWQDAKRPTLLFAASLVLIAVGLSMSDDGQ